MSLFGIHQELPPIVNEIEALSPSGRWSLSAVRAISIRLPYQDKPIRTDETIWLSSNRDTIDKGIERLKSVKKSLLNKMERGDNHALSIMKENGLTQAGKPGYGFRISQSNRVVVTNEDAVPEQFKKEVIRTSAMKREIKDWLKETGEIPDGIEIESREYVVLNK